MTSKLVFPILLALLGACVLPTLGCGYTQEEWDQKVREIGASRLLMAPAFLIETFQDGGLLVAASPLPWEDGRADRRSSALAEYLQGDGVWPGAPFVRQGVELIVT